MAPGSQALSFSIYSVGLHVQFFESVAKSKKAQIDGK